MASELQKRGSPYPSLVAGLGGHPSNIPDTPICAVFLVLYIAFAVTNMTIFQINLRRKHKFVLSAMLFGFSMARITTLVLRIAWANRPHNGRLAIAANIFVNAGVLLVYVINLILAQRILRAKQPHIGWHRIPRTGSKVFYWIIPAALIMVITAVVVSAYTLNPEVRAKCRDVQLTAMTYLLIFTVLPLLHIVPAYVLPRSADEESFGEGSMLAKAIIVALSTCMCILIAGFKSGATWSPPRPANNPAWYHSKSTFYVFNFMLEIMILCLLTFSRIDKRFYIPDGSTKPGDYSAIERKQSEDQEAPSEPETTKLKQQE
ncbi:hypothetical protein BJY04DRAFT_192695 [Aspergillus karnatakaensis]|uniref:uncharacterized protein n=1 Tax=Aspergillus karnatakaensis TaxID=1810916 RepID=UPI003CCCC69B